MSDRMGLDTGLGTGWNADPARAGVQHKAIFQSRPIYQAAGARRAPALDAQNLPGDVYAATYGDAQHAIGVVCAGMPESALGGLVAHDVGSALRDWLWSRRTRPPGEDEWTAYLNTLQGPIEARVSGTMGTGNVTPLSRRGQQLGSETAVGGYILALDGSVNFYVLGNLRVQVYAVDLKGPPAVYAGDPQAAWSSRRGLLGTPTWRRQAPAQGISLAVADLPTQWGSDYRPLYEPTLFTAAAGAMPATTSVAYVVGMIDPRVGPVTHDAAPQPFVVGMPPPDATRATQAMPSAGAGRPPAAPMNLSAAAMPPPAPPRQDPLPSWPDRSSAAAGSGANAMPAWPDRPAPARGAPPADEFDDMSGLDSMSDEDVLSEEQGFIRRDPAPVRDDRDSFDPAIGLSDRPGAAPRSVTAGPLAMLESIPPVARLIGGVLLGLLGVFVLFAVIGSILRPAPPATPARPGATNTAGTVGQGDARAFPETNTVLSGRFRQIWENEGQLSVFGFPLDNIHPDNGLQVQNFERFRMELHPDTAPPYDVQFANLGAQLFEVLKRPGGPSERRNEADCLWFDQTQHNLCGEFRIYWTTHGRDLGAEQNPYLRSVALFGYPISDEVREPVGGQERIVQWFERARFEFNPEAEAAYRVQLTLLNVELRKAQGQ